MAAKRVATRGNADHKGLAEQGAPADSGAQQPTRGSRSAPAQIEGALRTFVNWWVQQQPMPPPPDRPAPCDTTSPDACSPLLVLPGPEHVVHFRQPVFLEDFYLGPIVDLGAGFQLPFFNCVAAQDLTASFAFDLRYEQRWFYRDRYRAALSTSIAMAPGENLSLSVRNTQRKQFDRETIDQAENVESSESTVADKDVVNVSRTSSKTDNWRVSGNGSYGLGSLHLGVNGSLSDTVTSASSSSAQRTTGTTRKSARNLKTLQKVQVKETSELTTEAGRGRIITNPFRDRSLRLDIYEMAKNYCLEFHRTDIVPALVLQVESLTFNKEFVLKNGAFLSDELLDRWLGAELTEAIQGIDPRAALDDTNAQGEAESIAWMALDYLFGKKNIFNFPVPFPQPFPGQGRGPGWDENDPASSFLVPLEGYSGLNDSTANHTSVIFSTLAFYYRLYQDHVVPADDHPLALRLALSLDQSLAPRWIEVDEDKSIADSIDIGQATEVLRRLSGFLTMTSGVLRPLLGPADEERTARAAARRSEYVIAKVVDHLKCHRRYYTERYLAVVAAQTQLDSVQMLAQDVLSELSAQTSAQLSAVFDIGSCFLSGTDIVIPLSTHLTPAELDQVFKRLHSKPIDLKNTLLSSEQVTVPMDGVHIEAVPGECLLTGISEPPPPLPLEVHIDK